MTITADGGWLTAVLLIALLVVGVMAYRKRWPSRKPLLAFGGGSSAETQQKQTVKIKEKTSTRRYGSGLAKIAGRILVLLLGIVALILIIRSLPSILDACFRLVGIHVVTPEQYASTRTKESVVSVQTSPTYSVNVVDGLMTNWIRVPEGYKFVYHVDGSVNGTIGMQCSLAWDQPSADASGDQYECNPNNLVARWFRPYILQHQEKGVVFNYYFTHP